MSNFDFDQSFTTLSNSHNALLESLTKIKNKIHNAWIKPKEKFLEASGAFPCHHGQPLSDEQREKIQQLFFNTQGDNASQAVISPPGTPKIMSVLDEIINKLQSLKSSLENAIKRTVSTPRFRTNLAELINSFKNFYSKIS